MSLDLFFLELCEEIERTFPVADWRCGDVRIWPLARLDLYLDLYWQRWGGRPSGPSRRVSRAIELAGRPFTNLWHQREDPSRLLWRPQKADAIFLGDGVSADPIDGVWEDRYGEPLMAQLEADGRSSFMMQAGDLRRAPWRRPVFAANLIESAGQILARRFTAPLDLPGHADVLKSLAGNGIATESLQGPRLARRAAVLRANAFLFERLLERVKPRLAFASTWYAGLGPAFLLACRRQGVLSVDLQHCPQRGTHKAYRWAALPEEGYALLPAVFWTWDETEAGHIREWASGPWHRALAGGNPRRDVFLEEGNPQVWAYDARIGAGGFERNILVALQTLNGSEAVWDGLVKAIESSPPEWRWWIRRHPAARPEDDARYGRLLTLRAPTIQIDDACSLPLPALLRHMSAVLSVSSGVGAEAALFGVPSLQLDENAPALLARLAELPARPKRPPAMRRPDPGFALSLLDGLARDYAVLCAGA